MVDTELLRDKVSQSGLKYKYIAKQLGLTAYGLKLKIDNNNDFKSEEIKSICKILKLSPSDRERIFFNQ